LTIIRPASNYLKVCGSMRDELLRVMLKSHDWRYQNPSRIYHKNRRSNVGDTNSSPQELELGTVGGSAEV
jgi:hypothetical protein